MTGRLLGPADAVAALGAQVAAKWASAVCAELGIGDTVAWRVPLRPGVAGGADVERLGYGVWADWDAAWQRCARTLPAGLAVARRPVTIRGLTGRYPATLVAADLDAAARAGRAAVPAGRGTADDEAGVDLVRVRALAMSLATAGARLDPALLRAMSRLAPADADTLLAVVAWLGDHPDVGDWTARQLPVPGRHTKWLERHGALLQRATGRDVRAEVRARPAVVHLTYVDPDYLATGGRRHDAWTTGDAHQLAYLPRTVLVVENRDSRLWFPPLAGTIVVEGGGKAAAAVLAGIDWLRAAEHLVYWGDIDADGFAILDQFRAALETPSDDGQPPHPVRSILMDSVALHRYAAYGVGVDRNGRPLRGSAVRLAHLTAGEAVAYDAVTTAGDAPFRRIEQELIPLADAVAQLRTVSDR